MTADNRPVSSSSRIEDLVEKLQSRWQIVVGAPIVRVPNFVAQARRRDGTPAILKIGRADHPEIETEIDALAVYAGQGITALLEADRENRALLIERLEPGLPLSALADDEQATRILASVMKHLWKPLPCNHSFPSVGDWAKSIDRFRQSSYASSGAIPSNFVDQAKDLFMELIETSQPSVLVHGDLHHRNVLSAKREEWLAVDPKGVAAEPAYETAAMLRNPPGLPQRTNLKSILARRIEILSEALSMDSQRILKWGIAQTVLSAVWSMEDQNSGWDGAILVAEKLIELELGSRA